MSIYSKVILSVWQSVLEIAIYLIIYLYFIFLIFLEVHLLYYYIGAINQYQWLYTNLYFSNINFHYKHTNTLAAKIIYNVYSYYKDGNIHE